MERIVTRIEPSIAELPRRKRVAAYARVSLGTEHMLHSLAAQVSYYSKLIQRNNEWEYAGVYADADETGTKESRPEFQRLLTDCRAGLIDIVLTKSISRFARNTVTLLETVRELKGLGIDVFFEEQSIHTLSGDGELMLTILASYAQEESRSVSENIKWRKRNDMKNGKTKPVKVYGYETLDGKLTVVDKEAEVVRMIFGSFLDGLGQTAIANKLNEQGIPSPMGKAWSSSAIWRIITNPKMCGDILCQRTFVPDHLTKRQITNRGELPMFLFGDTHKGIVTKETFDAAQTERMRRSKYGSVNEHDGLAFRKNIYCGNCGQRFWRTTNGRDENIYGVWMCGGRSAFNGRRCNMRQIPEVTLMAVTAKALGIEKYDGVVFAERVERVIAYDDRKLTFVFKDGSEVNTEWQRRKTIPYSKIGFEKRQGRNICYSKCGKGNMSERRRRMLEKQKEVERNAQE